MQLSQANNRDVDTIVALTAKPREQANLDKTKELEERVNNGFWLLLPLVLFALLGFRRGVVIAAMFVLMPIDNANASPWVNSNLRGYQLYEQGNFADGAKNFNSPAWKGIAEYQSGDYEKAINTLKPLTDKKSRYNLANAYAQAGKLEESEAIYESILKDDPNDADAKKNLKIVKEAQEKQQQQQQQQQQKSEQNNSDKNKADKNKSDKKNQQSDSKQDKSDNSNNQQSPSDQSDSQQSNDQKQEAKDQQSGADGKKNDPQQNQQQNSQQQNEKQSDQDASANDSPNQNQQANEADSNEPSDEDNIAQQQGSPKGDKKKDADKKIKAVPAKSSDIKNSPENSNANPLSASNPVLKKLEQVPDNTSGLIRAQLQLQARQKQAPKATENSW